MRCPTCASRRSVRTNPPVPRDLHPSESTAAAGFRNLESGGGRRRFPGSSIPLDAALKWLQHDNDGRRERKTASFPSRGSLAFSSNRGARDERGRDGDPYVSMVIDGVQPC